MKNIIVVLVALLTFRVVAGVSLTKVGEYSFAVDGCGGIAYAGDKLFYILRDHNASGEAEVYPLTLELNTMSGAILGQTLGSPVSPGTLNDSEGIAWDPRTETLWISDEAEPSIREFYTSGFQTGRSAPVPVVQKQKRSNRSLEALTLTPDGRTMWTASDLSCDTRSA